jgi:hypothetical protein
MNTIGWKRRGVAAVLFVAVLTAGAPSPPRPGPEEVRGGGAWLGCAVAQVLLCGIGWPSCPRVPGGCSLNLPRWAR